MKVFIVLCETGAYFPLTSVDKVFLDENKAYTFADEQNSKYPYFNFLVEEREVE